MLLQAVQHAASYELAHAYHRGYLLQTLLPLRLISNTTHGAGIVMQVQKDGHIGKGLAQSRNMDGTVMYFNIGRRQLAQNFDRPLYIAIGTPAI